MLPFDSESGRGFGSVFHHQLQQGPVWIFTGRGLSHWRRTGIALGSEGIVSIGRSREAHAYSFNP